MLVLFLLLFLPLLHAAPPRSRGPDRLKTVIPLSQQLHVPARIKHGFSFTFSGSTFDLSNSSGPPNANYSTSSLPGWLSFDSSNRTFWGTPSWDDEGSYSIELKARSEAGVTGSDTFNVLVTQRPGQLNLTLPIKDQLLASAKSVTSAYPYSLDSPYSPGVRIPPNWSFSIGFQTWTFTTPSGSRVYYTPTLHDGSPLPDWLAFNNSTVTFNGYTPKVNQTTVYQIRLGASDVPGYQDVFDSFNITISPHEFIASPNRTCLNITADGTDIEFPLDLVSLKHFLLDGKPIHSKDLPDSGISLDPSSLSWLSYNSANSTLTGSAPEDLVGTTATIPLNLIDRHGDFLNTTLNITFVSSAFSSPKLSQIELVPGVEAKIPLEQYLSESNQPLNISATFEPDSASSFLTLSDDHILKGNIPQDIDVKGILVRLLAIDPTTNATSKAELPLTFTTSPETASMIRQPFELSKPALIAIITVASIIGSLLLLCLILLILRKCCSQRKKTRLAPEDGDSTGRNSPDDKDDGPWLDHEYKAETPGLEYSDKFGGYEPPSAKSLMNHSQTDQEALAVAVPQLSSGASTHRTKGSEGGSKRFLINPFSKKAFRPRPKISNPIVMPSFSNAAFQAQLAAAVDSAGIVKRGTTYTRQQDDSVVGSNSEYTDSAMLDSSILSTGLDTEMETEIDGTTSGIGSEENSSRMTVTDDSQFNEHSSRASWESEPPFSWTQADTPKASSEGYATTLPSEDSRMSGTIESTAGISEPVQRSEFRPTQLPSAITEEDIQKRSNGFVPHRVVTPLPEIGSDEGISIDNIHFPTDSDIALTEASSDHEVSAVITTASRIDARRTLDGIPISTSSPASSHTEKVSSYVYGNYPRNSTGSGKSVAGSFISSVNGVPSPVMTTHSRLVSFGKEKQVKVVDSNEYATGDDAGKRTVSQTAVVVNSGSSSTTSTRVGDPSSLESRTGVLHAEHRPATNISTSNKDGSVNPTPNRSRARSRSRTLSRSRSPSPPMSFVSEDSATPQARPPLPPPVPSITREPSMPSPPASLPSLPALPSISKIPAPRITTQMIQRILLGVAEPFHFYPPLSLSHSPSNLSNNSGGSDISRPNSRPGATYHAFIEKKSLQGQNTKAGIGKGKERDVEIAEENLEGLPPWLRFEDMELWGVPGEGDRGVWSVRVIERMEGSEKVVGRFALEVVGRS